jgi:ribosomal protein S18 acetylase RimI-like enzyme
LNHFCSGDSRFGILIIFNFFYNLFLDGQVRPTDSFHLLKKVDEVRLIVCQELGYVTRTKTPSIPHSNLSPQTSFLCIHDDRVVGMVVVENIQKAYRLLPFDTQSFRVIHNATDHNHQTTTISNGGGCTMDRSMHPQPAILGVHILWVHSLYRHLGLARRLVDAAREKMFYGLVVPIEKLAFSSPTQAGLLFAIRYCDSQFDSSDQTS